MRCNLIFLSLLLSVSSIAHAEGNVYRIAEPDALEEIEQKAREADWESEMSKDQDDWSVWKGVPLSPATKNQTRHHIPLYVNELEVKDPRTGRVIYPKGYTFNILQSTPFMYFRVIFARPEQKDWVKAIKQPTDVVIFTHGNVKKIGDEINVNAGILDPLLKERFDVKVAPTIVRQVNKFFVLEEVNYTEWKDKNEQ